MSGRRPISRVLDRLAREYDIHQFVKAHGRDPFRILIGCILSLRTRDDTSIPATDRLFRRASDPATMARMRASTVEKLIYPVGFYRRKAAQILAICRLLIEDHDGKVPSAIDDLLALPGVGRKTANLVVTLGFGLPGICVDTHVHRICNRLGWLETDHPDRTEQELRAFLPRRFWVPINEILVRHGQNICKPIGPRCDSCPVEKLCPRLGLI
jgi:endonuclease-3